MEKKKLLFFIKDQVPTKEELEEAAKIGTKAFRCAKFVGKTSPIEKADGYFGAVPPGYSHLVEKEVKENKEEENKEEGKKEEENKEEGKKEDENKEEGKKEDEKPKMAPKKVAWTPNN